MYSKDLYYLTVDVEALRLGLFNKLSKEPGFIFLCSNFEVCEDCADYVRQVFSLVPGFLAAVSSLVVFLSHVSKTFHKENGEIYLVVITHLRCIYIFYKLLYIDLMHVF